MIGPYDMSGTMGIPGQIEHPRVKEACQRVIEACKSAGVACGTQITEPSIEAVQGKLRDGFTFIILSSDIFLLWKWTSDMRKIVDAVR
jgi:2-dehydro-3-deoxyglucarate aldolase